MLVLPISQYLITVQFKQEVTRKETFVNDVQGRHPVLCGCVFAPVSDCGPAGSPGIGELHRLSRLGELLLVETSLLVDEEEEALDTTKPGDRQPCRTGERTQTGRSVRIEALSSVPAENSPDLHSRPSVAALPSLSAMAGSI